MKAASSGEDGMSVNSLDRSAITGFVTRHRTDGAMVRLITAVPIGADEAAADRQLTEFASRIAPDLSRYIPN